ncbi:adenylate kinase family protein [Candidatus Dependentiae bacterium]
MNKAIGYIIFTVIVIGTIFLYTKHYRTKDMTKDKVILTFFGAPGCGKGTLAAQVVDELGYQVISTGDLCRSNIAQKTDIGKEIEEITKSGNLVPDDTITKMLINWIEKNANPNKQLILDGFPRTKAQAEKFALYLKETMPDYKFRIVAIDLPEEEIVSRLTGRRVCDKCKSIFNISMPEARRGICPKCGGKLIQRADDKKEVILERLKVYKDNETDLLDFYKSQGYEIEKLNISGLKKEEVFEEFKKIS